MWKTKKNRSFNEMGIPWEIVVDIISIGVKTIMHVLLME